jgi:hypothetical protein
VTDRPIIFSAPMVQALLAGRKTQTRRLATSPLRRCEVGDRLYVREAFAVRSIFTDVVEVGYEASKGAGHTEYVEQIPVTLATGAKVTWPQNRPSIHMPRWASRLTLTVMDVRVEPLVSISDGDAIAEGIGCAPGVPSYSRFHVTVGSGKTFISAHPAECFARLWSSLHSNDGECWSDNPDVVALTFSVERQNIDQVTS